MNELITNLEELMQADKNNSIIILKKISEYADNLLTKEEKLPSDIHDLLEINDLILTHFKLDDLLNMEITDSHYNFAYQKHVSINFYPLLILLNQDVAYNIIKTQISQKDQETLYQAASLKEKAFSDILVQLNIIKFQGYNNPINQAYQNYQKYLSDNNIGKVAHYLSYKKAHILNLGLDFLHATDCINVDLLSNLPAPIEILFNTYSFLYVHHAKILHEHKIKLNDNLIKDAIYHIQNNNIESYKEVLNPNKFSFLLLLDLDNSENLKLYKTAFEHITKNVFNEEISHIYEENIKSDLYQENITNRLINLCKTTQDLTINYIAKKPIDAIADENLINYLNRPIQNNDIEYFLRMLNSINSKEVLEAFLNTKYANQFIPNLSDNNNLIEKAKEIQSLLGMIKNYHSFKLLETYIYERQPDIYYYNALLLLPSIIKFNKKPEGLEIKPIGENINLFETIYTYKQRVSESNGETISNNYNIHNLLSHLFEQLYQLNSISAKDGKKIFNKLEQLIGMDLTLYLLNFCQGYNNLSKKSIHVHIDTYLKKCIKGKDEAQTIDILRKAALYINQSSAISGELREKVFKADLYDPFNLFPSLNQPLPSIMMLTSLNYIKIHQKTIDRRCNFHSLNLRYELIKKTNLDIGQHNSSLISELFAHIVKKTIENDKIAKNAYKYTDDNIKKINTYNSIYSQDAQLNVLSNYLINLNLYDGFKKIDVTNLDTRLIYEFILTSGADFDLGYYAGYNTTKQYDPQSIPNSLSLYIHHNNNKQGETLFYPHLYTVSHSLIALITSTNFLDRLDHIYNELSKDECDKLNLNLLYLLNHASSALLHIIYNPLKTSENINNIFKNAISKIYDYYSSMNFTPIINVSQIAHIDTNTLGSKPIIKTNEFNKILESKLAHLSEEKHNLQYLKYNLLYLDVHQDSNVKITNIGCNLFNIQYQTNIKDLISSCTLVNSTLQYKEESAIFIEQLDANVLVEQLKEKIKDKRNPLLTKSIKNGNRI